MNITDYEAPESTPDNIYLAMYEHCEKRLEVYKQNEKVIGLGLLEGEELQLDNPKHQYLLKDFFWRITEEISEAKEWQVYEDRDMLDVDHVNEELIDALIFFTHTMVLLRLHGHMENIHLLREERQGVQLATVVWTLGLAANCLKNKPWKSTHVPTDRGKFYNLLSRAFDDFCTCLERKMGKDLIWSVFYRKQKVNEFRTSTNY